MITQDGMPWEDARSLGDNGPTNLALNIDCLAAASRTAGYDLCLHPMSSMIDMTGLTCKWCDQAVTAESASPEARQLRTAAILATYPELAKR